MDYEYKTPKAANLLKAIDTGTAARNMHFLVRCEDGQSARSHCLDMG